jgi:hypothetical protein
VIGAITTHEEADAARAALADFYGAPVWPVDYFCTVLDDWFRACAEEKKRYDSESPPWRSRPPLYEVVEGLMSLGGVGSLDVIKSNYLGRRLYGGEAHRTEKCPYHDGHWGGLFTTVPRECDCAETNYNRAGWVPAGPARLLSLEEKQARNRVAWEEPDGAA